MTSILSISTPPLANIMFSFNESNFASKMIILILFFGSIYAWSIMVSKFVSLNRAQADSNRFLMAYRKEKNPVALFLKRHKFPESPLYKIYESTCLALGGELEATGTDTSELLMGGINAPDIKIGQSQMDAVRNNSERNVADQALQLESQMGVLATAVSASPFLGLLGTVWGVMEAFSGMAVTGSATLGAVAPGIAGALLTTVLGLVVAIPSSIGYNLLTSKIRALTVQMDNFAQEFEAQAQTTFVRE